ncbi:colicin E5-related ribonuclease, partial [Snodgrassella communis]|uniref:colicin E5-related ribonuclease n=1 Tax=Snodgrassella communis TaxID=2946699 RepID=UPI00192BFCC0
LRLAGKELLALNSAEELVTSTGHVIKNAEANAIKSESREVGKEAGKEAAKVGKEINENYILEQKIQKQMQSRGWTSESINDVITNPNKKISTTDTRFDPTTGTRLNDPATAYIAKDGSYVVKNDRTGTIVQISNKNDRNWKAPWDK